jgi:uncharacterized protein YdhG (YjbR/CyaY superfamily)
MNPKNDTGFSSEERAAMKQRAKELKASEDAAEALKDLLAKIAAMTDLDRANAERIHEIVTTTAPQLMPKTYYGMPAYYLDGKVVCFFKNSAKFKERYSTFGLEQRANLDDGTMWPVSYAITTLSAADEKKIAELVTQAIS